MYRLKETPPIMAMEFVGCPAATYLAALPTKVDALVVRAAVFRTINDIPYLLLMKRSETDSLPGRWEVPGGGVDDGDKTIRDAVSRELEEETGLTASWLVQEVGSGIEFPSGRGTIYRAITFVVEIDEIGAIEYKTKHAGDATKKEHEPHQDVLKLLEQIPVRLHDKEHQQYRWATEEEVKSQRAGSEKLVYVSEDMKQTLLQSFEVQKQVIDAKASLN